MDWILNRVSFALAVATAAPLLAAFAVVAAASGVLVLRQLWIAAGPPRRPAGGSVAQHQLEYIRFLEARADAFESALHLYASNQQDGGAEARRILDQMNGETL